MTQPPRPPADEPTPPPAGWAAQPPTGPPYPATGPAQAPPPGGPQWAPPSGPAGPGPQWAPPSGPVPQWAPPSGPPPQWGPPATPAPGNPPLYYPPGAIPEVTGWIAPGAPEPVTRKRRRPGLIVSAIAVVALAAGGIATFEATSASSSTGAASPQAAVQGFVTDLNHVDLLGMIDDLPPGERDALASPVRDIVGQLKRQHVLSPSADASHLSGVTIDLSNLTYAPNPITINDHVRIVELTGGQATLGGDLAKIPLASQFLADVAPGGKLPAISVKRTFSIAQAVKSMGGPIRIATEKVGSRWYPSLFYTIADNAVTQDHLGNPTAADQIPAVGASSPTDAAQQMITALLSGIDRRAIELLSPDEMAVMHDYGGLLLSSRHSLPSATELPFTIEKLQFATHTVSSGVVRVSLASAAIAVKHGPTVRVSIDGSCISVQLQAQPIKVCANDVVAKVLQFSGEFGGSGLHLTAAQTHAIEDVFSALLQSDGTIVTETGGQWYISPVQTVTQDLDSMLSHLGSNDILTLIGLAQHH
jgi:hypothetical protein